MSRERLDEEQAAVEAVLQSLDPAASSLELARVMYLAGRASARPSGTTQRQLPRGWFWPCTSAVLLVLCVALGCAWMLGGRPQVIERVQYVQRESPTTPGPPSVPATATADGAERTWRRYEQLRRLVAREGLDALPELDLRAAPWAGGDNSGLERLFEG